MSDNEQVPKNSQGKPIRTTDRINEIRDIFVNDVERRPKVDINRPPPSAPDPE